MLDVARHFLHQGRGPARHRPARRAPGQPPALPPHRRPGLAHRDPEVPAADRGRGVACASRRSARSRRPGRHPPTGRFDGRPHGGYYTQDDIREIVAYAAARFVTVVPEIETPGHVRAALAAYPELGVHRRSRSRSGPSGASPTTSSTPRSSTIEFFQDVLDEVIDAVPARVHRHRRRRVPEGAVGGRPPHAGAHPRARPGRRGAAAGLVHRPARRARRVARASAVRLGRDPRGRHARPVGHGACRGVGCRARSRPRVAGTTSSPRRTTRSTSTTGRATCRTSRSRSSIVLTVDDVFAFDPVPAALTEAERAHVIGGQGNMWTEHVDAARKLDYQLFPRVAALAEALWSADVAGPRDLDDFRGRLASTSPGSRPWASSTATSRAVPVAGAPRRAGSPDVARGARRLHRRGHGQHRRLTLRRLVQLVLRADRSGSTTRRSGSLRFHSTPSARGDGCREFGPARHRDVTSGPHDGREARCQLTPGLPSGRGYAATGVRCPTVSPATAASSAAAASARGCPTHPLLQRDQHQRRHDGADQDRHDEHRRCPRSRRTRRSRRAGPAR